MAVTTAPFIPPCCPNPRCHFHALGTQGWRYKLAGSYLRQCRPQHIQRYRCLHCGRYFSTQTFSVSYWLRHPEFLLPLLHRSLGCSGCRQIAREFHCAPTTVMRQLARLGRHCLLFHELQRPQGPLIEPLVVDGFESFEFSQYHPVYFNLAAGQHTHYFYAFTDAELRRKGRMTEAQRRRRALLEARRGRPDPRAIELETAALLHLVAPSPQRLELHTDDHRAYPRALRRLPHLEVRHRVTSSRARRTSRNPLFPVNLLDLLIRHCGANHKRETIAFSKRRQAAAERLAILLVWRNYLKSFSERRRDATPAMRLGLMGRAVTVEELLARRLFPSQIQLPERLAAYYWRRIHTRAIPRGAPHRSSYAA